MVLACDTKCPVILEDDFFITIPKVGYRRVIIQSYRHTIERYDIYYYSESVKRKRVFYFLIRSLFIFSNGLISFIPLFYHPFIARMASTIVFILLPNEPLTSTTSPGMSASGTISANSDEVCAWAP